MGLRSWYQKYLKNEEADQITEILPGKLYLGNWKCAYYLGKTTTPSNVGNENNMNVEIRHVINMTPHISNFHNWYLFKQRGADDVIYMDDTGIQDNEQANVSQHFERTFDFIDEVAKEKPVLVHCVVGASRSSSVVIAYLMKKNHWNVETALNYCKSRRSVVKPNRAFLEQLHKYAIQLGTETADGENNGDNNYESNGDDEEVH